MEHPADVTSWDTWRMGKWSLEEIYRFENGMVKKGDELCWEFDRLFQEVVNGLKKCKEIGKIPVSMGVDTWGVDFVLLIRTETFLEIPWIS